MTSPANRHADDGSRTVPAERDHLHCDPGKERAWAERLCALIGERFVACIGAWHDQPVGPHLKAMYQVAFATGLFPRLVPWLMLNRMGL
jgi:aromatic ring-cleaving dioxygenase